ncbi:MAG: hypothetical protein ACFFFC_10815 [Candidatus Thorarchaeota archaeon]
MGNKDEQSKKIRGRLVESIEDPEGQARIVVDTVFSGRVELVFNESSIGNLSDVGAWVNIIHSISDPPVVTRIWSDNDDSQTVSRGQKTPISLSTKQRTPQGPVRSMKGELIKASVSETPSGRLGSITLKVLEPEVNLIIGSDSKGAIPPIGSFVSVDFEDTKVPRIINLQKTDDTSLVMPLYTPHPSDPWLVRWPKACMSCGESDFSKLKFEKDVWTTDVGKPKSTEGTGQAVLRIINNLMVSMFTPYPARIKEKKMHLSISLPIKMYTCKECIRKRPSYQDSMDISLAPRDDNRLMYHFEFKSPKFEEYFREHNPVDIEPKIEVQVQ